MKCLLLLMLGLLGAVSGQNLRGKTVTVTSFTHEPFLKLKDNTKDSIPANRYEGYIKDLLLVLAKKLGFRFTLQLSADGRYGALNKTTGTWSGMIGEVVSGKVDMAVADITITSQREKALDFTYPFMFNGLTILIKKPPKGEELPIHSFDDLAHQNQIQYGTAKEGSTFSFFRDSNVDVYQRIYEGMKAGSVMRDSYKDGVKAVLEGNGKVAWVGESPYAELMVARHCDLVQVGGTINMRGYGIALPTGSPYREELNVALLEFQQDGLLEKLRMKWFYVEVHNVCWETEEHQSNIFGRLLSWIKTYSW